MENKKKQITQAVIILFIAVGVTGYFYYFKNKTPQHDNNNPQIIIEKQKTAAKQNPETQQNSLLQASNPVTKHKQPSNSIVVLKVEEFTEEDHEDLEDQTEALMEMEEYINSATEETDATEVVMDTPGYAAFRIDPINRGDAPETAENMAKIYFEMFPDEERIRISLLIGGGVRGARTYKRDDVMQDENY